MPGENTSLEEPPVSALETCIHQLQTSITQIWNNAKVSNDHVPHHVVIWGTDFGSSSLASDALVRAIQSRICFTYRSGFEPIMRVESGPGPLSFLGSILSSDMSNTSVAGLLANQHFTTDVGWGCMIRTSQSLLANALQSIYLGHDYHYEGPDSKLENIIALFADEYKAPFSLHNFIRVASESPLQVKPGEWFGPSAASLSIQRLCERFALKKEAEIQVLISENCDLYDTDMEFHFAHSGPPLLILFPIRLGIENVNVYYHTSLSQLLSTKQSVGIAGGKPSSSYYFVGYQDSELLYLDPHNLQVTSDDSSTYHTSKCQLLPVSELDPSMLIGIVLSNIGDYHNLRASLVKTNKIVHFHSKSSWQKSTVCDEYANVTIQDLGSELVDDFVNVSDQIIDIKGCAKDEFGTTDGFHHHTAQELMGSSINNHDVVIHAEMV